MNGIIILIVMVTQQHSVGDPCIEKQKYCFNPAKITLLADLIPNSE